jgi:hypothetical protein
MTGGAAGKQVLQAAGVVECLDRKWVPQHLSQRNKGTSKKFGLGESHPRYSDFQFVLKHQPVIRVGVKATREEEDERPVMPAVVVA